MMVNTMKNPLSEHAFTGIEAAVVFIAFVSVAIGFTYVVLGAGFFTTDTAQGTIHAGMQKAGSVMTLVGNVYGVSNSGNTRLNYINLTVALTPGGTPMDLSRMVVSYSDNNGGHNAALTYEGINGDGGACTNTMSGSDVTQAWCIAQKINNETTEAMLENNARMIITVGLPDTATPNTKIKVNLQPETGAVLPIVKTVPNHLSPMQALY